MGGPTYLAPVIQQIAEYAEKELSQCSQHYTIGLVIVDGIVNDVESLVDKLIDVGNLPVSIVVVGVGPADFRLMVRYWFLMLISERDIIKIVPRARMMTECIKNNQDILLDLADFALQEQPEDNLMVAIPQAWYNGSYTMAAKPMKFLELHFTVVQFLMIVYMPHK